MPWEADLARMALEAEGIPTFVADANTVAMCWIYSNAIGGAKLQVPESLAQQAIEILSSTSSCFDAVAKEDNVVCPRCGGRNTAVVRRGRRWAFLTWLILGFLAWFPSGFPAFWPPKRCRCSDCGHVWKERPA
jgi:rubredoxin